MSENESGFPVHCGEPMYPLYDARQYWCRECDHQTPMPSLLGPTDREQEAYQGRIICETLEAGPGYAGSCPLDTHIRQMRDPDCWVHSSVDRWLEAYVAAKGFYLQAPSGNRSCMLWWSKDTMEKTANLADAKVYTKKELPDQMGNNVAWPKVVVDRASIRHCQMDKLLEEVKDNVL